MTAESGSGERSTTPDGVDLRTDAGLLVAPVYTSSDLGGGLDALEARLGVPGEPPFTRGPYPSMYRGKLWTMRQFSGFGTAADTNRRFHYLLKHGQDGLSVAFHIP